MIKNLTVYTEAVDDPEVLRLIRDVERMRTGEEWIQYMLALDTGGIWQPLNRTEYRRGPYYLKAAGVLQTQSYANALDHFRRFHLKILPELVFYYRHEPFREFPYVILITKIPGAGERGPIPYFPEPSLGIEPPKAPREAAEALLEDLNVMADTAQCAITSVSEKSGVYYLSETQRFLISGDMRLMGFADERSKVMWKRRVLDMLGFTDIEIPGFSPTE